MSEDYYALLGISNNASDLAVKKSFRKLALQYHPDKNKLNGAEEKFKKILKAYQVLRDKKSRDIYDKRSDQHNRTNRKENSSNHKSKSSKHFHRTKRPKNPINAYKLEVSLEELLFGCTKKVKTTRNIWTSRQSLRTEPVEFLIDVKPGLKAGTRITFAEQGNQYLSKIPADIVFVIEDKPHKHFKRDGSDIIYLTGITVFDAMFGCELVVPQLIGKSIAVHIPKQLKLITGYDSNITVQKLCGLGLPFPEDIDKRGDLIIKCKIK